MSGLLKAETVCITHLNQSPWTSNLTCSSLLCSFVLICFVCLVAQSCSTLFATPWTIFCQAPLFMEFSRQEYFCNPMNYILPGSSVRGIFQARILEWAAISFLTQGLNPHLLHWQVGRWILYHWATWEALVLVASWEMIIFSLVFIPSKQN